jgi:hypothetical protein
MSNFTLSLSATALVAGFLSNSGFAQSAQFYPIPNSNGVPGSNPNGCYVSGGQGKYGVRISSDGSTVALKVYQPGPSSGAIQGEFAIWTENTGTQVIAPDNGYGSNFGWGVSGISSDGSIVYGADWVWRHVGGYQSLASTLIPWGFATIFGCSEDGSVVSGFQPTNPYAGDYFRWQVGQPTPQILPRDAQHPDGYFLFNCISGDGTVVGGHTWAPNATLYQTFAGALVTPAGATLITPESAGNATQVYDLSIDGSVAVGQASLPGPFGGFGLSPFRWTAAGGLQVLPVPGSAGSANACSILGDVVVGGYLNFGTPGTRAFVWRQGVGFFDLQDELEGNYGLAQQLAGWTLLDACDVSADGRAIVGYGRNPQGCEQAFVVRLFEGVTSYCTSATSSAGCVATLVEEGAPSASANSGFNLRLVSADAQRQGLIFYGVSGRTALPWASGSSSTMCVKSPTQRMTLSNTAGALGTCNGSFATDWLAYLASSSGALAAPATPGQLVQAQAWYRDPPAPKSTNLSNALEFTVLP